MAGRNVTVRFLGNTTHLDQALAGLRTKLKANLGGTAGLIGLASFAAAGVALFKLGEDFDKAYNKIRVGTGATGKVLQGLETDFKNVLKDTPASFGDTAQAITELNQKLGLTGKPLEEMSHQMLELSRITGTDLKGNLDGATNVLNNFGVKAGDQSNKLDELFRASQATGISFSDLAGTMSTGGVVLRTVGFDFEHSATLVAGLSKAGIDASTVFPAMAKALKASGDSGKNANTVFAETIDKIKSAKTEGEAFGVAAQVFGAKAGPKLAALIREGKLSLDGLYQTITNGKDTIDKAGKDAQTFGDKWTIIKNNVFVALEPIATGFTNIIEKLSGPLEGLASAFAKLPDPVKEAAAAVVAMGFAVKFWGDQMGAALLKIAPLAIAIGVLYGLAEGVKAVVSATHESTSSAARLQVLANGLYDFSKYGKLTGPIAKEMGSNFEKLASSIKHLKTQQDQAGSNFFTQATSGFAHWIGLTYNGEKTVNDFQDALLKLYKTDPKDAVAAFTRMKDALLAQHVPLATIDKEFGKFEGTAGLLTGVLAPMTAAQQQSAQAADDTANAYKDLTKVLDKLGNSAGQSVVDIAQGAHLTTEAVKQLTTDIDGLNKAAEKGFDFGGEAIKKFTQTGKVNFDQFKKTLTDNTNAAGAWAANIGKLADAGLNQGFLKSLLDAGPAAATLAQSLADHINDGGVKAINNLGGLADNALTILKAKLQAAAVSAATGLDQVAGSFQNYQEKAFTAAAAAGKNRQANIDLGIATTDLTGQIKAFVDRAVAGAQSQADLAGATFGTTEKTNAQRDALQLLEDKFPGLKGQIETYGQTLINATPPARTTTVDVNTGPAEDKLAQFKRDFDILQRALSGAYLAPSYSGPSQNVPVPRHAAGGFIVHPEFAIIGEAGPEVILPLKDRKRSLQLLQQSGLLGKAGGFAAGPKGGAIGGSRGETTTVINLTVNALDPRAAEDGVIKALQGWARRNGPVPVKVAG